MCHGTGYVAKPVAMLAETLWQDGWEVHRFYYPNMQQNAWKPDRKGYCDVHLLNPQKKRSRGVADTADEALVTATLQALGVTVL